MCGISGALGQEAEQRVERMLVALAHRGPDGEGRFAGKGVALGHRRLAIIDLDGRAAQPMTRGALTIVFNGEIYNYRELRSELEVHGDALTTSSDTEVLLLGFARWGLAWVEKLRGMFAFAVWDANASKLTLARDRLGIKPLYHTDRGGGFAFASEVRALLAVVPRVVDSDAVFDYWRYGAFLGERTVADGVRALPPGYVLEVDAGGQRLSRWYDLAHEAMGTPVAHDYAEACATLRSKLEAAARYHLVADVPVGAFLSAGIDSTLVAGLLSRMSTRPLETFTLGFEDAAGVNDERAIARTTAAMLGTQHHELVIRERDVPEVFEDYLGAVDVPSGDGANTYLIARLASRMVKVAVSGLGGDELFAGYPHFRHLRRMRHLPRVVPRFVGKRLGRLKMHLPRKVARALDELGVSRAERFDTVRRLADDSETRAWLRVGKRSHAPRSAAANLDGFVARLSHYELGTYLVDTLLRDSDVMSMASGLELRPLLLDHPLVEWTLAQPDGFKLSRHGAKRMLIDATRDLLPERVLNRGKTGFDLPLGRWLRTRFKAEAIAAFSSPAAHALLSDAGRAMLTSAVEEGKPLAPRAWSWFALLDYIQRYRLEVRV